MHTETHAHAMEEARPIAIAKPSPHPRTSLLARLLEGAANDEVELSLRLGTGLGLASVLGLAIGLRMGGPELAQHAIGVPLVFLANLALGVPALGIGLSFFDAEITPKELLHASVDAVSAGGIAFAGLAPACALFVLTAETMGGAAAMALVTLTVGSTIALLRFTTRVGALITRSRMATLSERLIGLVFIGFAAILSLRIFFTCIPLLDPSVRS